jgi:hypothetical protein
VRLHVTFRNRLNCTKGLSSILGIVDVRNVAAVDPEAAFPPRRYFRFKTVVAHDCDKLLDGSAFSCGQRAIRLPVQHSRVFRSNAAVKGHRSAGN